jgi:hypothetical protein
MEQNKSSVLITRTLPLQDFTAILNVIEQEDKDKEIVLLLQKEVYEVNPDLRRYRAYLIDDGHFRFRHMQRAVKEKLSREKLSRFVICCNNPSYLGYEEYIKLSLATHADRVLLITKDFQMKKMSKKQTRSFLYKHILKKYVSYMTNTIGFVFGILFYAVALSVLWVKYRINISRYEKIIAENICAESVAK